MIFLLTLYTVPTIRISNDINETAAQLAWARTKKLSAKTIKKLAAQKQVRNFVAKLILRLFFQ